MTKYGYLLSLWNQCSCVAVALHHSVTKVGMVIATALRACEPGNQLVHLVCMRMLVHIANCLDKLRAAKS